MNIVSPQAPPGISTPKSDRSRLPWIVGLMFLGYLGSDYVRVSSLLLALQLGSLQGQDLPNSSYGEPRQICTLQDGRVTESSGLAMSQRHANLVWTHNDSGDKPRLYCFDLQGRHQGTCQLKGAKGYDWEDMCSYTIDGKAKMLVADTGDNATRRKHCYLHILDEPENVKDDLKDFQTITLQYEDGAIDCEAVAVDTELRQIVLIEKKIGLQARVYQVPLPRDELATNVIAKQIAVISLPIVTAMDISPDGRHAVVLTLGQAFEYFRAEGEAWSDAFKGKPKAINTPPRRQGEAICFGPQGIGLYLSSEQRSAPLFYIPVKDSEGAKRGPKEAAGKSIRPELP